MSLKKTMDSLRKHLSSDEKISSVVYGTFESEIIGKDVLKKGVLVATDKRVIFFHRGMFGLTEKMEVFPYQKITAITFKKALMGEAVVFMSSGSKTELKWISEGDGLAFVRTVNNQINQ